MKQSFYDLQKKILSSIKAEVRKNLGPQPKYLKKYYEAYKREFRVKHKYSSKQELIQQCLKSDIVLIGDYHTFSQSQKTALRILREIIQQKSKIIIGLEMLLSEHQKSVNAYLSRLITEAEFLEEIDYDNNWGFPWKNFKPIFEFAQANRIPILALNIKSNNLKSRDEHAADIITRNLAHRPNRSIYVLYGDLHLARGHIPKEINKHLKHYKLTKKTMTIFQNSESLYWKLAEANTIHKIDVLKLSSNQYCIMNAAPWIKLQSYLHWFETGDSSIDDEINENNQYPELIFQYYTILAEALKFKLSKNFEFKVLTSDQLSLMNDLFTSKVNKKSVDSLIIQLKTIYFVNYRTIYLNTLSINAICESAAKMLYVNLTKNDGIYTKYSKDFYKSILHYCFTYFGTKLLNHKRKCDLEEDYEVISTRNLDHNSYDEEYILKLSAGIILKHLSAQRIYINNKKYAAPKIFKGKNRDSLFIQVTSGIGNILGEKLYLGFVTNKLEDKAVIKLYKNKYLNVKHASVVYFTLLRMLSKIELPRKSKINWL